MLATHHDSRDPDTDEAHQGDFLMRALIAAVQHRARAPENVAYHTFDVESQGVRRTRRGLSFRSWFATLPSSRPVAAVRNRVPELTERQARIGRWLGYATSVATVAGCITGAVAGFERRK